MSGRFHRNTQDAARADCRIAFEGDASVWQILATAPDRYTYDAVKHGITVSLDGGVASPLDEPQALPEEIAIGLNDVTKRTDWNRPASPECALPTETWREVVARWRRYTEVWEKLAAGEVQDSAGLVTYNLDIRQFAQDVIESCEGPELLRALWKAIQEVTVLDPTCGSGAFLFAALNVLEPLYEACLERMEVFLDEQERLGGLGLERYSDFRQILDQVAAHPNRRYFVLKSIIVNNLYGVDIMEEAVEICKLRLFLKLVAQVDAAAQVEPLPDIDFNIRVGNTLVGFAALDDVRRAMTVAPDGRMRMVMPEDEAALQRIEEKAREVERLFAAYREGQTARGGRVTTEDKQALRARLAELDDELNRLLAAGYGVEASKRAAYSKWLDSYKPFHWFVEFFGIIQQGGFDIVIGNPPYVDYAKVRGAYEIRAYRTEASGNLYAYCMERSMELLRQGCYFGMIVPVSSISGENFSSLMDLFRKRQTWLSSYSNRPGKLFQGVEQRLTIFVVRNAPGLVHTTPYQHWYQAERERLFPTLQYVPASVWPHTGMPIKSGDSIAESVFARLMACATQPLSLLCMAGTSGAWFHDGPTYWVRALSFQPNAGPGSSRSSHYHRIPLKSRDEARGVSAIMNSSIFYFFFKMVSNCRDLGNKEWSMFPIGSPSHDTIQKLAIAGERLERELLSTAQRRTRNYPSGVIEYEEYYPARSKSVIDEIDSILAQHYGFTDEELDFIINYDIKYRMGTVSADDESEE